MVLKAVRLIGSIHEGVALLARGQISLLLSRTVFSPQHFPKFLGSSMALSGVAGYSYMQSIQEEQVRTQYGV